MGGHFVLIIYLQKISTKQTKRRRKRYRFGPFHFDDPSSWFSQGKKCLYYDDCVVYNIIVGKVEARQAY